MKRFIYVIALAIAIAGRATAQETIPQPVFEQTVEGITIPPAGYSAKYLLEVLSTLYKFEVIEPEDLSLDRIVVKEQISGKALHDAIYTIVQDAGVDFQLKDGTLFLEKGSPSEPSPATGGVPQVGESANQVPVGAAREFGGAHELFCLRYNCIGLRDDQIAESMNWEAVQQQRRRFSRSVYPSIYRPGIYNGPVTDPTVGGVYANGNYGIDTGYLFPFMKGCQDGRPTSYLEFQYKGLPNEKHLWLVSINNVGVGTVDQGDTLSQKLRICSDAAVVITIEKIGATWKWERQYSLRPITPTEVPVGDFLEKDKPRIKPQIATP